MNASFARQLRLRRLYRHRAGRLLVVPLDHTVTTGPIVHGGHLDDLVGPIARHGADAIVLHKGSLRHVDPAWFRDVALVVHLSASTAHALDPDAKRLVCGVEEALRLGADAVSVHVNLGAREEPRQLEDLAEVAEACERWSVPLLAMVYPRGPRVTDPADPERVAHAVTVAAELGADLVKTVYPGSMEFWTPNFEYSENDWIYSFNVIYDSGQSYHVNTPDQTCIPGRVFLLEVQ